MASSEIREKIKAGSGNVTEIENGLKRITPGLNLT